MDSKPGRRLPPNLAIASGGKALLSERDQPAQKQNRSAGTVVRHICMKDQQNPAAAGRFRLARIEAPQGQT
ncbi:hypothetical protein HaLaN_04555 [Haematococcus lacustris]|uniref:Uncharacterized protein n=1 Tax=Haematococcus lacustris TaxID=44745 RepID=A0A699YIV8_HAELA|nr:hypothetical protein HaLaN_04555 [Haematococcus lacustris]